MNDLIVQLASDLDAFACDYDYYGYMDAIDDWKQAGEDMKNDLIPKQTAIVVSKNIMGARFLLIREAGYAFLWFPNNKFFLKHM